jgi:hypothetical protein
VGREALFFYVHNENADWPKGATTAIEYLWSKEREEEFHQRIVPHPFR